MTKLNERMLPNVRLQVLVFVSEIKLNLTPENQFFCFFYAFIYKKIGFYLLVDSYVIKTNFFLAISLQFGLVQRV